MSHEMRTLKRRDVAATKYLLLAALCLGVSDSDAAANWVEVQKTSRATYSVDESSIAREGSVSAGWVQIAYSALQIDGPGGIAYRLTVNYWKADCSGRRIAIVEASYRNAAGVEITTEKASTPEWNRAQPDTVVSAILDRLCEAPIASNNKKEGPRSTGTGFLVDANGKVLTNSHVVEGCVEVGLTTPDGQMDSGSVIARDSRNDLALIASSLRGLPFASFRRAPLRAGEQIIALGYPLHGLLASDINVSAGIVSAMAGLRNDTSKVQISAPVQPGNSGGPVLDLGGQVIGVVVSKLDALNVALSVGDIPQNVNFAINGQLAQLFLRSHGVVVKDAPSQKRSLTPADVVEVGRPFTLLITCYAAIREKPVSTRETNAAEVDLETVTLDSVGGGKPWCKVSRPHRQIYADCAFDSESACRRNGGVCRPRAEVLRP